MAEEITATMSEKEINAFLSLLGAKHLQKATANTLNEVARRVNEQQKENVKTRFTLRNNYTISSLRIYTASAIKKIDDQNSVVGSTSPYLPIQEEGGTVKAQKNHIPIPTDAARGGNHANPVLSKYRLSQIQGKAFVLEPANPVKTLTRRGLFYRVNEKEIVKIRDLEETEIEIKRTNWHSDAVQKWATQAIYEAIYKEEARKVLEEEFKN